MDNVLIYSSLLVKSQVNSLSKLKQQYITKMSDSNKYMVSP